jgi:hypothetical protein
MYTKVGVLVRQLSEGLLMKNFIDVQIMEVIRDKNEIIILKIYQNGVWHEISYKEFCGN